MPAKRSSELRDKVANEAAMLLYSGQEKEFKQAKLRAAKTLGARELPSNAEVAELLDRIAEEQEGKVRKERLVSMREEALRIMKLMQNMHPLLIGSVWRGTAHKNSDIDIVVFSNEPNEVLQQLIQNNYKITKTEWQSVTKHGEKIRTFHIHFVLNSGYEVEIIVRNPERMHKKEKCEIYGDMQTGLNTHQLQQLLKTMPAQKFTPI